jgi:PAS domain S-box-containing protein
MPHHPLPVAPSPGRLAFAIALIYAALAAGWIIYSDRLLAVWVHVPERLTELQTWKGMFFVLSTSALLWAMIRYGFASVSALQQRLADREAAVRLALEATRLGLWDYRVGEQEITTNDTVARMLGHAPEGFQETVPRWLERLHPDERDEVRQRFRAYLDGLMPDYMCEFRMRVADGSYRWFRSSGEVIERDGAGRPLRVIGTYLDIHDQVESYRRVVESELRTRLYFERMPIGCVVTDTDWRVVECNAAFESMFGYPAAALKGRSLLDTIIPEAARGQTEVLLGRLRNGSFDSHNINENLRHDGQRILCEWFNSPILDADGKVVQLLAMAIDITAREATDRALADSHRHLSDLSARLMQIQEDERGHLARELHDEIGQQLTAVRFNLHALGRAAADDATRTRFADCLGIIDHTIERIRDRALDLRPPMLDDLGLAPALDWLASDLTSRVGVPVKTAFKGQQRRLPPDSELALFRIAQEALRNVEKHAEASEVALAVTFEPSRVYLKVSDNGRGFVLPRVAQDLAAEGKLGLAGIQERAQLLGGVVRLSSRPGQGTTVEVSLNSSSV